MEQRIGIAVASMAALLSACTEAPEDDRADQRASALIGQEGGTVQTSRKSAALEARTRYENSARRRVPLRAFASSA